jgi:hypothetical protein
MANFLIELGTKAKSKVTGFSGVITSRAEHLNGCNRYWIEPPVKKDGSINEGRWMDEVELIVLDDKKIPHKKVKTGGPSSPIK